MGLFSYVKKAVKKVASAPKKAVKKAKSVAKRASKNPLDTFISESEGFADRASNRVSSGFGKVGLSKYDPIKGFDKGMRGAEKKLGFMGDANPTVLLRRDDGSYNPFDLASPGSKLKKVKMAGKSAKFRKIGAKLLKDPRTKAAIKSGRQAVNTAGELTKSGGKVSTKGRQIAGQAGKYSDEFLKGTKSLKKAPGKVGAGFKKARKVVKKGRNYAREVEKTGNIGSKGLKVAQQITKGSNLVKKGVKYGKKAAKYGGKVKKGVGRLQYPGEKLVESYQANKGRGDQGYGGFYRD